MNIQQLIDSAVQLVAFEKDVIVIRSIWYRDIDDSLSLVRCDRNRLADTFYSKRKKINEKKIRIGDLEFGIERYCEDGCYTLKHIGYDGPIDCHDMFIKFEVFEDKIKNIMLEEK